MTILLKDPTDSMAQRSIEGRVPFDRIQAKRPEKDKS